MPVTAADPYNYAAAFQGEAEHLGPLNKTSIALAASIVIPGASLLYGLTVFSTNAGTQFVFVFDGPAVPASGTPPAGPVFAVSASGSASFLWLPPRTFNAGIVIANSTSATSFATGAADCWFDVQYR